MYRKSLFFLLAMVIALLGFAEILDRQFEKVAFIAALTSVLITLNEFYEYAGKKIQKSHMARYRYGKSKSLRSMLLKVLQYLVNIAILSIITVTLIPNSPTGSMTKATNGLTYFALSASLMLIGSRMVIKKKRNELDA
ncbi:hypothetical protein EEL31_23805 [Brevibacillus laterosporus]|nr:hypothetical protein [Brevibacillus laterosporus]TPG71157.1 hypothetical protein EEL31_23805 [Brevibacillus laterosporus]